MDDDRESSSPPPLAPSHYPHQPPSHPSHHPLDHPQYRHQQYQQPQPYLPRDQHYLHSPMSAAFEPGAAPFVGNHHPGRENGHRTDGASVRRDSNGGAVVGPGGSAYPADDAAAAIPARKRKADEIVTEERGKPSSRRKASPQNGVPPSATSSGGGIGGPHSAISSTPSHLHPQHPHPSGVYPSIAPHEKKKANAKPRDRELERLEREKHEAAGKLKPRRGRPSQAQLEANEEEMRLLREQALATALGGAPPPTGSTAAKAGLPIPKANPEAEAEIKAKLEAHKRRKAEESAKKDGKARIHQEQMARMGVEVLGSAGSGRGSSGGGPPMLLGGGGGGPPALLGSGAPYGAYPYPPSLGGSNGSGGMHHGPPGGLLGGGPPINMDAIAAGRAGMPPPGTPNLPLPSHMRPPPGSMPNQRFQPPPHALGPSPYASGPPPYGSGLASTRRPSGSNGAAQGHGQAYPHPTLAAQYRNPPPPITAKREMDTASQPKDIYPNPHPQPRERIFHTKLDKDKPPPPPLRPLDDAYQARLEVNRKKETLQNVSGPAPVWANKRKGLTSALEYFQDPVSTLGGSVEIGSSGLARMIMFEGDIGDGYVFWGTGRSLGTAVLPFGNPRRKRSDTPGADNGNPAEWSGYQDDDPFQPASPQATLDRSLENAATSVGLTVDNKGVKENRSRKVSRRHLLHEAPEIAALLLAHRARVPIAIGISEDFKNLPWRLPRPYIVLGWFYITDAWLEPHLSPSKSVDVTKGDRWVRWRFRFDWCKHGQTARPWWGEATSKQPCLFEGIEPDPDKGSDTIKVAGKDISTSETLRFPKSGATVNNGHPELDLMDWVVCRTCGCASLDIYSQKDYCINELCPRFFIEKSVEEERVSRKIILRALRGCKRISPNDLGLNIRPAPMQGKTNSYQAGTPISTLEETTQSRISAGRDFWKGWCCNRCGMACERRNWKGWDCEGCGMVFEPTRKIWKAEMLSDPSRPICTGPRIDDGYARFPPSTVESAVIWDDGLRICLHGIDDMTEIHHALGHHGNGYLKPVDHAFEALQAQGEHEVLFRRVTDIPGPNTRPTDIGCSPFYTALTGSDATPLMESIPSYKPKPWTEVPPVCTSIMKEMNDCAGRMIDGEKTFNTLLLVSMPANLPHIYIPKIRIPARTNMAFLILGSDALFTFKKEGNRSKRDRGELTAFHGDHVVIRTHSRYMDVNVRMMGFGFVAIGRQIYPRQEVRGGEAITPLITEAQYPPPPPGVDYPIIKLAGPKPDTAELPPDIAVEDQGWNLGGVSIFGGDEKVKGKGKGKDKASPEGEARILDLDEDEVMESAEGEAAGSAEAVKEAEAPAASVAAPEPMVVD